ncbi:MAG: hypothetical protein JSR59_06315 [Proteobacteria bacterium]|nr:hypothetical protein [Pseudomonadota bacterium]
MRRPSCPRSAAARGRAADGADASIAQLGLRDRLTSWPYRRDTEPLHLVLNARHAALAPRLGAALAEMKADGTIDRYYADALQRKGVDRLGPEPKAVR